MKNILVIGAHFDDPELGCGGTMARLAAEGKNVYKLTLTDNATDFKQMNIKVETNSSKVDSANACKVLGVTEITDFKMSRCNQLEYTSDIMQRIETIIFEKNIDTAFIHYDSDMNQDHVAASKICLTAARHCKNILYYQSNGYILNNSYYPNIFFDISDYYDAKKDALDCYRGDHNRFNRLFDMAMKRTEIMGYANEVNYAEGFVAVKFCY